MNRQELSEKLAAYRKENGPAMKVICTTLSCLPQDVYRVEKGQYSYNLQKCIDYMDAVGLQMTVTTTTQAYVLKEYNDVADILKELLSNSGLSQRALGALIGCSHKTIQNAQKTSNKIGIDIFLKLMEIFECAIEISPKAADE